jgi:outer membrane biosynthesis protein TonB
MDKRTTAIIATVVTGLLCGCPGLAVLCFGALAIPISFTPGAQIDVFGSNDPQSLLTTGIVGLCLGILLIAIPVIVGFTTLRNRPAPAGMVVPPAPPRPVSPAPETPFAAPPAPPEKPQPPAEPWMEAQVGPLVEVPPEKPPEPPTPASDQPLVPPSEEKPPVEPPAAEDDDSIPPAI